MLDRTGLGLSVPEVEVLAEVVGRTGLEHLEELEELEPAQGRRSVERVPGPPEEELKMDLRGCLVEVPEVEVEVAQREPDQLAKEGRESGQSWVGSPILVPGPVEAG